MENIIIETMEELTVGMVEDVLGYIKVGVECGLPLELIRFHGCLVSMQVKELLVGSRIQGVEIDLTGSSGSMIDITLSKGQSRRVFEDSSS